MLQNKLQDLKKKAEGFTIIEVMIVLVIAAVIILIVFLAVPALQRNSRNNQRKNDVARISAAVTEAANNNNGQLPTTAAEKQQVVSNVGDLGFYSTFSDATAWWGTNSSAAITSDTQLKVVTGAECGSADEAVSASGRQFVILYAVETGGSTPDSQCIEG